MIDCCINCDHCDPKRINNEGRVRCKRLSIYVDREAYCDNYHSLERDNFINSILKEREQK